jgi:hypothetical protein
VAFQGPVTLEQALANLQARPRPLVIEIQDSMIHDLDLAAVAGVLNEDGGPNLLLNRSLIVRAAADQRPIIRLAQPMRFRPRKVTGADANEQNELDGINSNLVVRLEGVYLTRGAGFPAGQPLIARAAVHALELVGSTLDPGGFRQLDDTRAPSLPALSLAEQYGFAPADEAAFKETPEVDVVRSIVGSLLLDEEGYSLSISDSIIDAGRGVADLSDDAFAVSGATDPVNGWGPPTTVAGATFFGRTRVTTVDGGGGIWVHALEALNNQKGCVRLSYFCGTGDRLPQNYACVRGTSVRLRFASEAFGDPGYGQLALSADRAIRERGPGDDAMGAYGFTSEAHKWRNLQIRFREFMPVGVRPLLIPVT